MQAQFLSIDLVIDLHKMLIRQFGGLHGIRDKKLLESAMAYPQLLHTIGMEQDIYLLAAAYLYHLINNHAFIDENKRIGTLAALTFLKINGKRLYIPKSELYELAIKTATSKIDEKEIAKVLKKYLD
jgi:death-on-curing protein